MCQLHINHYLFYRYLNANHNTISIRSKTVRDIFDVYTSATDTVVEINSSVWPCARGHSMSTTGSQNMSLSTDRVQTCGRPVINS